MKTKTLLMTAVMLLCFSAVASAQNYAIYSVSSTPITTVIATGNAELAGNITFTHYSGTSASGTITISYGGANITSPWTGITIVSTGGYLSGTTSLVTVNTTASTYTSPAQLVLNIPASAASGTLRLPASVYRSVGAAYQV